MTSEEFTEWAVYERMFGPLGPERQDVLQAVLQAFFANALSGKGKTYRYQDFLIAWGERRPVEEGEEEEAEIVPTASRAAFEAMETRLRELGIVA